MPALTEQEQNQIKALLGYAAAPNLLVNELREEEPEETLVQVREILVNLLSKDAASPGIDLQLMNARSDSMAMGVGNLKLSYSQHVAHLKSEGSRYLQELSNLLGVEIIYDKYRPRRVKISYW